MKKEMKNPCEGGFDGFNANRLRYNTAIELHYYRNSLNPRRFAPLYARMHTHPLTPATPAGAARRPRARRSLLAWPAWLRVLAVLPAVALLWLAVAWASLEAAPW